MAGALKSSIRRLKSPLRYPGGKSRAVEIILRNFPDSFSEYREPMVGGGSVFIAAAQKFPSVKFWINDANFELYSFWKAAKERNRELCSEILEMKNSSPDGKNLFRKLAFSGQKKGNDCVSSGARFFVLNRITFSGTTESGGYSKDAFKRRFTLSSIERVFRLEGILSDVRITNFDYGRALAEKGNDAFIFLDPPYLSRVKSRLYGKSGSLHTSFDHEKFARRVKACRHKWLITYDNSIQVHSLFSFAERREWTLQYGMNNFGRNFAPKGRELFISNYFSARRDSKTI